MRKEYGKALRTLFAEQMKQTVPHFEEVKVKSMYFWPGDRAYRWQANDQLHCWIVLSPSKKDYDEFTVLIGWSKQGRYPELGMVPCAEQPTPNRDEFANEEYLTRLPYLWTDEDRWWVVKKFRAPKSVAEIEASLKPILATEAKETVAPLVRNAIGKIQEFGLPYLEALSRVVTDRNG
jgi:hypothetical protein